MSTDIKVCSKNPAHVWMADMPYCPYCNLSQEARMHGLNESRKKASFKNKIQEPENGSKKSNSARSDRTDTTGWTDNSGGNLEDIRSLQRNNKEQIERIETRRLADIL